MAPAAAFEMNPALIEGNANIVKFAFTWQYDPTNTAVPITNLLVSRPSSNVCIASALRKAPRLPKQVHSQLRKLEKAGSE